MAISCHAVLGLVVIWFCGLAISCHVVFYVGHLSAFVASTGQPAVDGTIGRYRSCLHSPVVVEEKEEMLAKKEKKAKERIEKEEKEQLTGNGRKGLELREGGKEMF